jgi:phage shock protein E
MRPIHRNGTATARSLVALALAVLTACALDSPQQATSPSPAPPARLVDAGTFEEVIAANPGAPVINVHVPYEGHVAGTTDFVPYDTIRSWSGLPSERGGLIVLYCRSGNMSAQAARTLAELGYTNIVDLDGGMHAWTASGRTLSQTRPS